MIVGNTSLTPELNKRYVTLICQVGEVLDSDDEQMVADAIVDVLLFEREHQIPAFHPLWAERYCWEADAKDPHYEAWVERQAAMFDVCVDA